MKKTPTTTCTCTTPYDNPLCPEHIVLNTKEDNIPVIDGEKVDISKLELPPVTLADIMSLGSLVDPDELPPYIPPTNEENAINHIDFACMLLPETHMARSLLIEAIRKIQQMQ